MSTTTPTPRFGLVAPNGDDPIKNGDDLIRAIVAALDPSSGNGGAAKDLQGLDASRPTGGSQPPKGTFYFATDTNRLYRSDGSAWTVVTDATYKTILRASGGGITAPPAGTYVLSEFTETGLPGPPSGGSPVTAAGKVFWLDPADFVEGGRTGKLRVRAFCLIGSTAPATTMTVGLYPVSTWSSASAITGLGPVVTGSTVAFASPAVSTQNQGSSGDFAPPAAGFYVIGVAFSGNAAASSLQTFGATLQARQA